MGGNAKLVAFVPYHDVASFGFFRLFLYRFHQRHRSIEEILFTLTDEVFRSITTQFVETKACQARRNSSTNNSVDYLAM